MRVPCPRPGMVRKPSALETRSSIRSIPHSDAMVSATYEETGTTAFDEVELAELPAGLIAITLNL